MINFLSSIPKVELHAHLNGCIRESTLLELAKERSVTLSPLLHELRGSVTDYDSATNTNANLNVDSIIDFKVDVNINANASTSASDISSTEQKNIYSSNTIDTCDGHKSEGFRTINTKQRSLTECFEIFAEISKCVTDLCALKRITEEALKDFDQQNVAYLELRSTPKILYHDITHQKKATKKDYVDTILKVFKEFETEKKSSTSKGDIAMIPRFIISINRAEATHNAMENAKLAIEYKNQKNKYVVGLDLSGNPHKNQFHDLEPAFLLARNAGLKTSIHFGEIQCEEGKDDIFANKDTNEILSFRPDRLGHSLLLTKSMFESLDSIQIPVECCPTSNVMTLELAKHFEGDLVHGLKCHPRLKAWLESDYPISINTDDPGIFNTNSTLELILLAEAFHLKHPDKIVKIIVNSVDHVFESTGFKETLKREIIERMQFLLEQYESNHI